MCAALFNRTPEGIADMGIFCVALVQAGIAHTVKLYTDTTYVVEFKTA